MAFFDTSFFKDKLSKTLLFYILLVSGMFTVASVYIQLNSEYEYESNRLLSNAQEIAGSYEGLLKMQLLEFNKYGLQKTLDSIVNFESVARARIKTRIDGIDNAVYAESGKYPETSETLAIGSVITVDDKRFNKQYLLELISDQNVAKKKVIDKFFIIVVIQCIKTIMVSLIILYMIHMIVTRHVEKISNWLIAFNPNKPFSPLITNNNKNNELNTLQRTVNEMGRKVYQYTNELEKLVAQRTVELSLRTEKLENTQVELEVANRGLQKLAFTDSLTKVASRTAFFIKAEEELQSSRRLSYDVGLLMLDLDHFKSINDNFGHDAGDEVLKVISKAMCDCLRKQDTLGRIGGEEFAIIVPGTDKIGMYKLAKRLQESIELQNFSFLEQNIKITVSIGYTKIKKDEQFKSALKRADEHLYTAKNNGRNQFFTDNEFVPSIAG